MLLYIHSPSQEDLDLVIPPGRTNCHPWPVLHTALLLPPGIETEPLHGSRLRDGGRQVLPATSWCGWAGTGSPMDKADLQDAKETKEKELGE